MCTNPQLLCLESFLWVPAFYTDLVLPHFLTNLLKKKANCLKILKRWWKPYRFCLSETFTIKSADKGQENIIMESAHDGLCFKNSA